MADDASYTEAGAAHVEPLAVLKRRLADLRPPLLMALAEDARMFSYHRGERFQFTGKVARWLNVFRLLWAADDFSGVALYRVRSWLRAWHVPVLPRLLHGFCASLFGIRIGDYVVIQEGLYIPHGQVVVDGITIIGRRCVLSPWTTLGVVQGNATGPVLEDGVFVGTGAKVLGAVRIGAGARIGANAVVLGDVPAGATAVGIPAHTVPPGDEAPA